MKTLSVLSVGDVIEIRYRPSVTQETANQERDTWIGAVVRHVEPCSWPIAHLSNGGFTEVRPFMDWRYAGSRS